MNVFSNFKNLLWINSSLMGFYLFAILFSYTARNNNSEFHKGQVEQVNELAKKTETQTRLKLNNGQMLSYSFTHSAFDRNEYLAIEEKDTISYKITPVGKLINLKNVNKNRSLSTFYLTVDSLMGVQYIILFLLLTYNSIYHLKFSTAVNILNHTAQPVKSTRMERLNDLTKKYPVITLVLLAGLFLTGYYFLDFLQEHQYILQQFAIYKYIYLFVPFIVLVPIFISNLFIRKNLLPL